MEVEIRVETETSFVRRFHLDALLEPSELELNRTEVGSSMDQLDIS